MLVAALVTADIDPAASRSEADVAALVAVKMKAGRWPGLYSAGKSLGT